LTPSSTQPDASVATSIPGGIGAALRVSGTQNTSAPDVEGNLGSTPQPRQRPDAAQARLKRPKRRKAFNPANACE